MDAIPAARRRGSGRPVLGRRARALVSRLAGAALDTLYPPTCLACRAATDLHGALCPRCWSAMRFIERPFCERLGTPFEHDLGQGLISPQAMADPPVFAGPGRSRGSRTGRRARSCIGSNIPTAPSSPGRSRAGWRARGRKCWPRPISWRRCRCIPCGCGDGGSTRPPRWPRRFRAKRASRAT